jgi:hypothetical protein
VVDKLAAVAPSNADHRLPRLGQPLGLGALGVAHIIFGGSVDRRRKAAIFLPAAAIESLIRGRDIPSAWISELRRF